MALSEQHGAVPVIASGQPTGRGHWLMAVAAAATAVLAACSTPPPRPDSAGPGEQPPDSMVVHMNGAMGVSVGVH